MGFLWQVSSIVGMQGGEQSGASEGERVRRHARLADASRQLKSTLDLEISGMV